ncbi:unnamed protein product [Timema podura]|uniref:LIM zinc-binding domain-containing protein n=1 Tax=Timema podura TaxID=61482 RepID=A0ABN7PKC5_TIMPD|nr:unnamed protein product [Timema podura]
MFHVNICVFLAERKTSLGKDWHSACLRCEKCNKTLTPGQHAEHEGKPYCHNPCYSALFGPGGNYTSLYYWLLEVSAAAAQRATSTRSELFEVVHGSPN